MVPPDGFVDRPICRRGHQCHRRSGGHRSDQHSACRPGRGPAYGPAAPREPAARPTRSAGDSADRGDPGADRRSCGPAADGRASTGWPGFELDPVPPTARRTPARRCRERADRERHVDDRPAHGCPEPHRAAAGRRRPPVRRGPSRFRVGQRPRGVHRPAQHRPQRRAATRLRPGPDRRRDRACRRSRHSSSRPT